MYNTKEWPTVVIAVVIQYTMFWSGWRSWLPDELPDSFADCFAIWAPSRVNTLISLILWYTLQSFIISVELYSYMICTESEVVPIFHPIARDQFFINAAFNSLKLSFEKYILMSQLICHIVVFYLFNLRQSSMTLKALQCNKIFLRLLNYKLKGCPNWFSDISSFVQTIKSS